MHVSIIMVQEINNKYKLATLLVRVQRQWQLPSSILADLVHCIKNKYMDVR